MARVGFAKARVSASGRSESLADDLVRPEADIRPRVSDWPA